MIQKESQADITVCNWQDLPCSARKGYICKNDHWCRFTEVPGSNLSEFRRVNAASHTFMSAVGDVHITEELIQQHKTAAGVQ